jgi:glycosyltransferase involved in cell wall biosynthesis
LTTFNREYLLSETVNSILKQTYTDFEIIIVDNMSDDATEEYVASLVDSRIHYFRNPNYGVIAVNRNYGIQKARGKFIAFCDDDDIWLADKLRQQVFLMERHPDVALCYTNAESFTGKKIIERRRIRRCIRRNYFFQLLRGNYIPNSSVLVRTKVFQSLGLFTTDATLREDYEMWLRIAKFYPLVGIDDSLIRYRIHPNNEASNRSAETLRSIRTVRSIVKLLDVSWLLVQPNLWFQFLKYYMYSIVK